jgi:Cu+-exporting ATPase
MTVDPATAPESRATGPGTVYFCSAHCAAAFDADTARHSAGVVTSLHGAGNGGTGIRMTSE